MLMMWTIVTNENYIYEEITWHGAQLKRMDDFTFYFTFNAIK